MCVKKINAILIWTLEAYLCAKNISREKGEKNSIIITSTKSMKIFPFYKLNIHTHPHARTHSLLQEYCSKIFHVIEARSIRANKNAASPANRRHSRSHRNRVQNTSKSRAILKQKTPRGKVARTASSKCFFYDVFVLSRQTILIYASVCVSA